MVSSSVARSLRTAVVGRQGGGEVGDLSDHVRRNPFRFEKTIGLLAFGKTPFRRKASGASRFPSVRNSNFAMRVKESQPSISFFACSTSRSIRDWTCGSKALAIMRSIIDFNSTVEVCAKRVPADVSSKR